MKLLENKNIRIICGSCYEFVGIVYIKGHATQEYKSNCGKSIYFMY